MATPTPRKVGRKPIGERAMTNQEKQQKRIKALKDQGYHPFLMWLRPEHLAVVKELADLEGTTPATALKNFNEAWLTRSNELLNHLRMFDNVKGGKQAKRTVIDACLVPPLPDRVEDLQPL